MRVLYTTLAFITSGEGTDSNRDLFCHVCIDYFPVTCFILLDGSSVERSNCDRLIQINIATVHQAKSSSFVTH